VHEARATEAVDHLQAAALELIEAARAFLDVLEELVGDRERFDEATDVLGAAAGAAARFAGFVTPTAAWVSDPDAPTAPTEPSAPSASSDEDAAAGEPAHPPVERIPVS
jgi:hypothetical protein